MSDSKRVKRGTAIFIAAVAVAATSLRGHEFWIEPETFAPQVGRPFRVTLNVGERFSGEGYARRNERIETFVAIGPAKETPIVGRDGELLNFARAEASGVHVLAYRGKRVTHEMPAAKFEAYLNEEGLAAIVARRAELKESKESVVEVYSRCAKSLVRAGAGRSDGFDRVVGLTLEILPLTDPYGPREDGKFAARVLHAGEPLAGAKVVAVCRANPARKLSAVTDAFGRVSFDSVGEGAWMLTTIHMLRAPAETHADWESLWASLTFEIPSKPATTQPTRSTDKSAQK